MPFHLQNSNEILSIPHRRDDLLDKIISTIEFKQRRLVQKKMALYAILTTSLAALLIFAINHTATTINTSGFYQFLSLMLSDFSVVATNWQTFIVSLLETLPATSIITSLTMLFAFLVSTKLLSHTIHQYRYHHA